ncbi:helix-turn-helix transcriptional regulator [Nocardia aurantiaca]|uniref:helix-turn-helix transcriptional regulator n=1 Tax=Nocardia aurantiaca TaxID=2675850 RepID=UPI0018AABC92|nr:helix-turn-helix transcriptional regulator [Nocardia aurantiaca]
MSGDAERDWVAEEITAPTFGQALRRLRDERGFSREYLAYTAGVSASYITALEKGEREKPGRAVVESLLRCLNLMSPLTPSERRHLLELAGLRMTDTPAPGELHAAITPDQHQALVLFAPALAAYVDPCGNVLDANDAWNAALPGLLEDGNVFEWMFGNELARKVQVDWESEARRYVQWLRGTVGRNPDEPVFTDLVNDLGRFPEFRASWSEGGVDFIPPVRTHRLRDPQSGEIREYSVQAGPVYSEIYPDRIILLLCVPI